VSNDTFTSAPGSSARRCTASTSVVPVKVVVSTRRRVPLDASASCPSASASTRTPPMVMNATMTSTRSALAISRRSSEASPGSSGPRVNRVEAVNVESGRSGLGPVPTAHSWRGGGTSRCARMGPASPSSSARVVAISASTRSTSAELAATRACSSSAASARRTSVATSRATSPGS
jgi:hypothetical protein